MKRARLATWIVLVFFLSGCADMTYRQKAALTGAAICGTIGAGVGGATKAGTSSTFGGVLIGAVSGALLCGTLAYLIADEPKPAPPGPAVSREGAIVLDNVLFGFNATDIRPDAAKILDRLADHLKNNPGQRVTLEGHTDSVGTDGYNQALSEKRAAAVRDYVVKRGISASRISTQGFGKTKPIADNSTDDGRAKNRRVEVRVS